MSDLYETELEMALRHVAAGKAIIARQHEIVRNLEAGGHAKAMQASVKLLGVMETSQRIFEDHALQIVQQIVAVAA